VDDFADRKTVSEYRNYKVHLEVLRLLAIFFVIFNHTKERGFDLYRYTDSAPTYYAGYTLSILCKVAVPIFFMISGALLIGREETIKDVFRKRILRIILIICVFTLLQYIRICMAQNMRPNLLTYLAVCYSGNIIEPYWYLKAYLGYLLVLPFLRYIAKSVTKEGQRFFVILCAIKVLTEILGIITNYQMNVSLIMCSDIICYPLLGYFLENGEVLNSLKRKRISLPAFPVVLILTVGGAIYYRQIYGAFGEAFLSVSVLPLAVLLFSLSLNIKDSSSKGARINVSAGRCVFGVYLIEDVMRNLLIYHLHWNWDLMTPLINCICFSAVTMVLASAIIYLLRLIPFVKKIL